MKEVKIDFNNLLNDLKLSEKQQVKMKEKFKIENKQKEKEFEEKLNLEIRTREKKFDHKLTIELKNKNDEINKVNFEYQELLSEVCSYEQHLKNIEFELTTHIDSLNRTLNKHDV